MCFIRYHYFILFYLRAVYLILFLGIEKFMDVVFVFAGENRDNINNQISIALRMSKQFHVTPSSINVGAIIVKRFGDVHEILDLSKNTQSKQQIIKKLVPYRYSIKTPDREISDRTEKDILEMFEASPRMFASKSVVFVVDSRMNYFLDFESLKKQFDELGINVVVVVVASNNQDVVPTYGNSYGADNLVLLKKEDEENKDVFEEITKKTLRGIHFLNCNSIEHQILGKLFLYKQPIIFFKFSSKSLFLQSKLVPGDFKNNS